LVRQADDRIRIMPGSGIRSSNIKEMVEQTGACEFHTSARIHAASAMRYINTYMQEDLSAVMADPREIAAILDRLTSLGGTEP
jgi:copper homeostasis protein